MPEALSLVVATPTRGQVHAQTVASVMAAVRHAENAGAVRLVSPDWWLFAANLPIPQAHETVAEAAYATGAELVWFIEDDNVPPEDSLTRSVERMTASGAGSVAVPYPIGVRGTRWNSVYKEHGEILFSGLGITLIRREVFDKLPRPWFRMDRWYGRVPRAGGGTKLGLLDRPFPPNVGGIDVAFFIRVREETGYSLAEVPGMVGGHIRITEQGAASGSGVNTKPHVVEVWDTIDQDQRIFVGEDRDRFWNRQWPQHFNRLSPWVTGFWLADHWFGGTYDAVNDPRLKLCREAFPTAPARVLELGSLEAGHTVALSRWAQQVTGIEARDTNRVKCEFILGAHHVENAVVVAGNLETMRLADLGSFDLVFSVGVLYHMPEPLELLDQCAAVAPDLFLWTHHSGTDERKVYREAGVGDPLSGMSENSIWLPRQELLAALRKRYGTVEVLDEQETQAGPAITVAARGARKRRKDGRSAAGAVGVR